MARAIPTQRRWLLSLLAWAVGLVIFFPILWTVLTSFKTEGEAISTPPHILFFDWTLGKLCRGAATLKLYPACHEFGGDLIGFDPDWSADRRAGGVGRSVRTDKTHQETTDVDAVD